jgi:hypothetical protein
MKTTLFSLLAAMTLSGVAFAETMTLYTDPATGSGVYTKCRGACSFGKFYSK